ncbi:MAG: tRNA (adenosine(37)-N6)-threonylcarbamoyltransferase complex dimerization subunit type 1 TsaB [Planctomycetota bacterium]
MTGLLCGILGLDLSGDPSRIALGTSGGIEEAAFQGERGRQLFPCLDSLLASAGLSRAELTGIVTGTGPGSYTGLRIACTAARTLSLALGIPAIGISTFEAAALAAPEDSQVHVLLDAHRREIYHAVYRRGCEDVEVVVAPRVLPRDEGSRAVPPGSLLIGDPGLCAAEVDVLAARIAPPALSLLRLAGKRFGSPRDSAWSARPAPNPLYLRAAALRRGP